MLNCKGIGEQWIFFSDKKGLNCLHSISECRMDQFLQKGEIKLFAFYFGVLNCNGIGERCVKQWMRNRWKDMCICVCHGRSVEDSGGNIFVFFLDRWTLTPKSYLCVGNSAGRAWNFFVASLFTSTFETKSDNTLSFSPLFRAVWTSA